MKPCTWRKRLLRLLAIGLMAWLAGARMETAQAAVIAIPSQEAVAEVPVVARQYTVAWLTSPVRLDGHLDDWKRAGIEGARLAGAVHVQWTRGAVGNAADAATFYLGRNAEGLYLAVETTSSRPPLPRQIDVSVDTLDNDPVITAWRDVGDPRDTGRFITSVTITAAGGRVVASCTPDPATVATLMVIGGATQLIDPDAVVRMSRDFPVWARNWRRPKPGPKRPARIRPDSTC